MTGLALGVVVGLCACGGDSGSPDMRVGPDVEGSGEQALLRDDIFRNAVNGIGVSPATRPVPRLGRAMGMRMRALVIDEGRLAPRSFIPGAYRRGLVRRGRITRVQFRRRYGQGPLEMCERLGRLVAQMDVQLDEGADPAPELPRAVLAGFGRGRSQVDPANRIDAVRNQMNQLLPDAGESGLDCASRFRSSYVFVARVYDQD